VLKIGVVGATGFIGSYLSRRLLDRGHGPLRLLIRRSNIAEVAEGAEIIQGDLLSASDCERFAAGLDVIYYLAHVNSPVNSDVDPVCDAAMNQGALLNLLQAAARLGHQPHIVYFSSGGAIYEPAPGRMPYRESDPCAPLSSYGIQKLAAEHYLRLAAHKDQVTATVLRVGNAYGTLLPQYRLQGLIGVAINSVLHRKPVRVFGSLENVRDYVHLDDICAFSELAMTPRRPFTVVNIGSGVGHSVRDVLGIIEKCYGRGFSIEVDEGLGKGFMDWVVLDISKARQEFGWIPATDFRNGIQRILFGSVRELEASAATV
jgi:UDP-glucose 4-epimerase